VPVTTGSTGTRPSGRASTSPATGRRCHWILEIRLVDEERRFGGFYEQLLDL
jgi:Xaa-Pro dipeptidase